MEKQKDKLPKLPYFTFSDTEMLTYLVQLDPIELKYNLSFSDEDDPLLLQKKLQLFQRISQLEETLEPSGDRDDDADKDHDMLRLLYGEAEPIDRLVEIVHLVRRKLITGLVSVEGMTNLFNCKYFTYEWLLHTEIDDKERIHRGSYYRDHFIHQARDAYSVVRLLEELPKLSERLLDDFMQSNVNVNAYLDKQASQMQHSLADSRELRGIYLQLAEMRMREEKKLNAEGIKCLEGVIQHMDICLPLIGMDERVMQIKIQKLVKREIIRNIMISSMVMAGLFHDIGYPIDYVLKNRDELAGMIPTAHFFIESIDHFTQIKGLLSNTLLFRLVGVDTIAEALKDQVHGALSAMAFLLCFYENGAIQRMDPLDQAAVEVAALSIFDHTLKYSVIGDKFSRYRHHHAVFLRNPMSFLLRFVDDIQEWDRVYFTVGKNRSLRICPKCHMPIVESKLSPLSDDPVHATRFHSQARIKETPKDIWARGSDTKTYRGLTNHIYLCGCDMSITDQETNTQGKINSLTDIWTLKQKQAKEGEFQPDDRFVMLPDIEYRKINHVKICARIRFHHMPAENNVYDPADMLFLPNYADNISGKPLPRSVREAQDRLLLHIDYDPFKALQMTLIDPSFSRYRSSELNKVRKLLRNQHHFAFIAIYANTTNNPIGLKVRILENFINDWYARFAKAEHLLRMFHDEEYKADKSVLLGYVDATEDIQNTIQDRINEFVEKLLIIHDEVFEELNTPPEGQPPTIRSPLDVLRLRIFMLLSENPRWSIEEIEATPRIRQKQRAVSPVHAMEKRYEEVKEEMKKLGVNKIPLDEIKLDDAMEKLNRYANSDDAKECLRKLCREADKEYHALYERLGAVRYAPDRILLNRDALKALLHLGYAMRYHFGNAERAKKINEENGGFKSRYRSKLEILSKAIMGQAQIPPQDIVQTNMNAGAHLDFYAALLFESKRLNALGKETKTAPADFVEAPLVQNFKKHARFGESIMPLLDAFCWHETSHPCHMRCLKGEQVFPDDYYNTYKIEPTLINAVRSYCHSENYAYRKLHNEDMLDVYSDLYMFYCLSNI